MKNIIYTRPTDGGVSIVIPARKESVEEILGQLTNEQYEAHIFELSVPRDSINARFIDAEDIPKDREFRNAWKQQESSIDFDLEKAREIQLDRIRKIRDEKLKGMDFEYMRATESGKDASDIILEKQKLRDVTEQLKNMEVSSIEDIKNSFPDEFLSEK